MSVPLQIGDVVTVSWDHRPIRILQIDPTEAFYDMEIDGVGWVMAKARTAIYYRTPTRFLNETVLNILPRPFTQKEDRKFRPDLPMRLFRHREADWSDELPKLVALEDDFAIPFQEIVIIPFGSKGGATKHVEVQAGDGKSLFLRELIYAAHTAQLSKCADVEGIGLYRSGIVGGVPSYYLWGAIDRAGHAA